MLENLLAWLVVGAVSGWLGNLVVNKGSGSLVNNIIVGIIGAVIGGFLFNQFGGGANVTGINLSSILVAFVGSVVLLVILKLVNK